MDLVVPPGPGVPQGLTVPAGELVERFSRSSGPGGQGVNTADSRVELELDVVAAAAFTPTQRRRVLAALGPRLVDERLLVVAASEHRQQRRNRVARARADGRPAARRHGTSAAGPPAPPARPAVRPSGGWRPRSDGGRRRPGRGRPAPDA